MRPTDPPRTLLALTFSDSRDGNSLSPLLLSILSWVSYNFKFQNLFWLHPTIPFQHCRKAREKKKKKQLARDQLGIRKRNIQPDFAFQALLSGQARGWWSTIPHPSPFRSIQHSHPGIFIFRSTTTSLRIISILQMGKLRLKVLDLLREVGPQGGVRI